MCSDARNKIIVEVTRDPSELPKSPDRHDRAVEQVLNGQIHNRFGT